MLEAIGLSSMESRVYTALVHNPRLTARDLARSCATSPALTVRALTGLIRRGMAVRVNGRPVRYQALAPDASIQPLLSRREAELLQVRSAVHELTMAFHNAARFSRPDDVVEVINGTKNIVDRAYALQENARALIRALDKPPYVMQPGDNQLETRRLREGVEYRVVYERQMVAYRHRFEDLRSTAQDGETIRILPEVPLKLWLIDDTAAMLPVRTSDPPADAAFVVHPSALLDALVALFEREWERAAPVRTMAPWRPAAPSAGYGQAEDSPDEQTTKLLALLTAGLTDEAMARALDVSVRTLQRRLNTLMRRLNATTRFQAGMAAQQRGWL